MKTRSGSRYKIATRCLPEVNITAPSGRNENISHLKNFTNITSNLVENAELTAFSSPSPTCNNGITATITTTAGTTSPHNNLDTSSTKTISTTPTTRTWPIICDRTNFALSIQEEETETDTQENDLYIQRTIESNSNYSNNIKYHSSQNPDAFENSIRFSSADDLTPTAVILSSKISENQLYETQQIANQIQLRNNSIFYNNKMPNQSQSNEQGVVSQVGRMASTSLTNDTSSRCCCSQLCLAPQPIIFLLLTLLMTSSATAMLCAAIMTDHWEHVSWNKTALERLTNYTGQNLSWIFNDKVAILPPKGRSFFKKYLFTVNILLDLKETPKPKIFDFTQI